MCVHPMDPEEEEVIPPQFEPWVAPPADFRSVVMEAGRTDKWEVGRINKLTGQSGSAKRKRDDDSDDEDRMEEETARGAEETNGELKVGKRRSYANSDNLGKKSGREWKPAAKRASAKIVKNDKQKKVDWDAKMEKKRTEKLLKERIKMIKKTELDKVKAEKLRREELKKTKEENRRKSTVVQKVTNKKTLKAMSKKAQKGVRFVKEVI
mmetsp:Transcript_32270/g.70403  ORF Transcript_32270/g.70403 Transcript_32270/m.70403 type:complete len:209 (-) Transcript_32270:342-968(-)